MITHTVRSGRAAALWLVLLMMMAGPVAAQRLPTNAVPEHYALWFAPDLQKATFRGRETIRLRLRQPSATITLNAAEIAFRGVSITAGGQTQTATVTTDAASEMATLRVARPIPAGVVTVEIVFDGILNDKLRGFYISKANGRSYAVTQMEATDARRAFPCFDEPAYKATFDISLLINQGDIAISNGPQISDAPGPEAGTHTVAFGTTPRMSTYLVAMLVGDFACRAGSADGIPVRVCSTPDKRGLTALALEDATRQVTFYNTYFGIRYPFQKLDIIGIPDFAAGAMENAGAITFRERMLLADPEHASLEVRKGVASVLAHEIAHQWFGDLVTMQWWDDLWLNEGFATWMASKPLAAAHPEWHVALDDTQSTQAALALDALRTTRAIHTKAETPAQINELFDAIAYEKTAAVLRMVENFVGAERFRTGVSAYLKKYAYGNATGADFWNEVTRVTGQPVDRVMSSFVNQPGAPLLGITDRCVQGSSELTLTQQRFIGAPGAPPPAPQTWTFPACFKTAGGQPRCELMSKPRESLHASGCNNVFANANSLGYYFSEYTPAAVRALARSGAGLTPAERIGLLGDEWWMTRSGRHDINVYLDLAGSFASDDHAAVLDGIAPRLAFTASSIADGAQVAQFESWVRERFSPALRTLGLPGPANGDDETEVRRAALVGLVGITGNDPGVQRTARELARAYLSDPSTLSPTIAPTILDVAALHGDRALYDAYTAKLRDLASQPEPYYRLFNALPWFADPALVQRTLQFAVSDDVRSQDISVLLGGLLSHPWARDAAWGFVREHWSTLTEKLGTFQSLPRIVEALGSFCSTRQAGEVRQFFASHPIPTSARTLQQALERIDACAAIDRRQSVPLGQWLATTSTQ